MLLSLSRLVDGVGLKAEVEQVRRRSSWRCNGSCLRSGVSALVDAGARANLLVHRISNARVAARAKGRRWLCS
jgi:hypothetical protein